jgi:hypothetical protein
MTSTRRPALGLTLALLLAGCSGDRRSNLSPRADQAPQRYEEAQREAEAVARANQQAEQAFLRGFQPPEPDAPAE